MVLRPISSIHVSGPKPMPVWSAIGPRQLATAEEYWLITQPEHAALACQLAGAIRAEWMPHLSQEALAAIAVHDEGWRAFDHAPLEDKSRPLSFIEVSPPEFLLAWTSSIEHAANLSPLGEIMVSRHFCRLLRARAESPNETPKDQRLMQEFLRTESTRQQKLSIEMPEAEIDVLVDVLQFCDVLSLYLCCGATEEVEFPQCFSGHKMRLRSAHVNDFALTPSPFASAVSVSIPAQHWPCSNPAMLPMLRVT